MSLSLPIPQPLPLLHQMSRCQPAVSPATPLPRPRRQCPPAWRHRALLPGVTAVSSSGLGGVGGNLRPQGYCADTGLILFDSFQLAPGNCLPPTTINLIQVMTLFFLYFLIPSSQSPALSFIPALGSQDPKTDHSGQGR